jgi:hypothetical protein
MLDDLTKTTWEDALERQLSGLATKYFPHVTRLPDMHIAAPSKDGPVWLDALNGIIYIDERVAPFQEKTTKILILHELIHWGLHLARHPDPGDEESTDFQTELNRIKKLGAYTGLL